MYGNTTTFWLRWVWLANLCGITLIRITKSNVYRIVWSELYAIGQTPFLSPNQWHKAVSKGSELKHCEVCARERLSVKITDKMSSATDISPPGEVSQTLYGFGDQSCVAWNFLGWQLLREAEECRWKNGGTDESKEHARADELVTDVLTSLMNAALSQCRKHTPQLPAIIQTRFRSRRTWTAA